MTLLKSVKTFDARLQCAEGKANSTCTVTSSWMRFQSVEANPSPLLSPVFARARIQLAGTVTPNTLSDWQIDDHDLISHGIKTLSKQVNFGHSILGDILTLHAPIGPTRLPTHSSVTQLLAHEYCLYIRPGGRDVATCDSGKTTSNIVS